MTTTFTHRPRRLRSKPNLRRLVQETQLSIDHLIMPLFVCHGKNQKKPIAAMPGQFQFSVDQLAAEIKEITARNIPAVLLFGLPQHKDASGSDAYSEHGIMQQAIACIKDLAPDLIVISDICCCEYTDHGHCGVIKNHDVDNDATLEILAKQAIAHAKAGSDMLAPSGMMDGMVASIRQALDKHAFSQLPILSYAVKYHSSLYGPFREAVDSAPQFGDRKTYQMNPANAQEALREAALDIEQGADLIMVKPAGFYLDVISNLKQHFPEVPLAAYQVSGEYSMIKAACAQGWINEENVMIESLLAIKRAGADIIISYFAKTLADYL